MEKQETNLTGLSDYCGCGAKFSAEVLGNLLNNFLNDEEKNTHLLIGPKSSDDAAAYQLEDGNVLLQSVDFFPPVVDDPYEYGQIAAANALSDIYAMGGRPITAMNLVCFPQEMDKQILTAILKGGNDKVQEAGAIVVGGHSIMDPIPKYGLSVTGLVKKEDLLANNTVKKGDCLILTKAIGTGIILAAAKAGEATDRTLQHAVTSMKALNKHVAEIVSQYNGVHACTDVTGFGLGGHLIEMMKNSGLTARIQMSDVPLLPDTRMLAEKGMLSGGSLRNYEYFHKVCQLKLSKVMQHILFDPQTSGGLLISIDSREARRLLQDLKEKLGTPVALIGTVENSKGCCLIAEETMYSCRKESNAEDGKNYGLIYFENTHSAMTAQKILKSQILFEIMPVPEEVRAGCGIALRFAASKLENAVHLLNSAGMKREMRNACWVKVSNEKKEVVHYVKEKGENQKE